MGKFTSVLGASLLLQAATAILLSQFVAIPFSDFFFIATLIFQIACLIGMSLCGYRFSSFLHLKYIDYHLLLFPFAAVLICIFMNRLLGFNAFFDNIIQNDPLRTIVYAVLLVLVFPFCEEIFFRGFGYDLLEAEGFPVSANLLFVTFFWIIVHFYILLNALALVPIGLLLFYARRKTGTVIAPFLAHAAYNLSIILQL